MKQKLIAITAAVLMAFTVITGCTTGTNNIAVKTEAGLIPSVNVAMEVWKMRVESGNATQVQIDKIHQLYDAYYAGQLKLEDAIKKSIASQLPADAVSVNLAIVESKASEAELLNTVNPLIK